MATGCLWLAWLPASLACYLMLIALITASYSLFQAANGTALIAPLGPARRGTTVELLGLRAIWD